MSDLKQLHDTFQNYIAKRDEIDAAKDAASAAKDTKIADLTQQLADAAAAAGALPEQIKLLQDGIDAAVAEEQAALEALTPPVAPAAPAVDPNA